MRRRDGGAAVGARRNKATECAGCGRLGVGNRCRAVVGVGSGVPGRPETHRPQPPAGSRSGVRGERACSLELASR